MKGKGDLLFSVEGQGFFPEERDGLPEQVWCQFGWRTGNEWDVDVHKAQKNSSYTVSKVASTYSKTGCKIGLNFVPHKKTDDL